MKRIILTIEIIFLLSSFVSAEEMQQKGISLTIYNQNFGLVRDIRYLNLKKGLNIIRFIDVAREIDATSVSFKSLTAPEGCIIQEQNFEYDLISRNKLLEKYLDQENSLSDSERKEIILAIDKEIKAAFNYAKKSPLPKPKDLFSDVLSEL